MSDVARHAMVDRLVEQGRLRDPALIAAFRAIPREPFVPYYFEVANDRPGWRWVSDDVRWRAGVYQDIAHVTQLDNSSDVPDAVRRGAVVSGEPTSSSSAPSLMAVMLDAVDLRAGHRVLEIGTGTGYNAALLAYRLGDDRVTSVDVDPTLVGLARGRLAALGHSPHLIAADGRDGAPERAPFDRIIATVGMHRVPGAWIGQCSPGAVVVAPLMIGGLLARLTVDDRGHAQGRFLADVGMFMPTRDRQHRSDSLPIDVAARVVPGRSTLSIEVATDPEFEFYAAWHVGPYARTGFTPSNGGSAQTWLVAADGSWVCGTVDHAVRQGGPRRLWDEIESAHRQWSELGRPARERFGLTVTATEHRIWLDAPRS